MRPPGWFRRALDDGEMARAAMRCKTQTELARQLGVTAKAFKCAKKRLQNNGVAVPSFEELRSGSIESRDTPTIETCAEYRSIDKDIDTPIRDRWPSVAAFDAEVPVPVVPTRHGLRGVSTLVDAEGNIKQQWIKTRAEDDQRQDWLEAIRDMGGELPRMSAAVPFTHDDEDLLNVFPVGDPHVGLLGWREDAGEDFDMAIAERNLVAAFKHLIDLAPAAAQALLIFIGDNTHVDGQSNTTTAGTRQDADSRTVKMARTILRICRRSIDLALAKHKRVRMIVERGNHDELISAMVALALSLAYENEPRVEIDVSPEMYHWFVFGRVLIGTHHGDKAKPMDLLGVMAVDRQADWSSTRHRRFYCGHFHHQIVKEVPGLIVEYLPTLAGSDAWHRSMGYRSQRAMYMDVFHRERGHINRHIIGIDYLREVAA